MDHRGQMQAKCPSWKSRRSLLLISELTWAISGYELREGLLGRRGTMVATAQRQPRTGSRADYLPLTLRRTRP